MPNHLSPFSLPFQSTFPCLALGLNKSVFYSHRLGFSLFPACLCYYLSHEKLRLFRAGVGECRQAGSSCGHFEMPDTDKQTLQSCQVVRYGCAGSGQACPLSFHVAANPERCGLSATWLRDGAHCDVMDCYAQNL